MYDTIYCSYDLGPGFHNRELQTKDLDCLLSEYWLDPAGKLWEIDYSNTADFREVSDWATSPWVPNGNHGKVRPVNIYCTIEVYPTRWDVKYAPYPSLQLSFRDGILERVVDVTNERNGKTTYCPTSMGASF